MVPCIEERKGSKVGITLRTQFDNNWSFPGIRKDGSCDEVLMERRNYLTIDEWS